MSDEPKLQDVIDLMMDEYNLIYFDRDDNLNEHLDVVLKAIRNKDANIISEEVFEKWNLYEFEFESVSQIVSDLFEQVRQDNLDLPKWEIKKLFEENQQEIEDEIYDRSHSDFLKEIVRNTENPVMRYQLDDDIETYYDEDSYKNIYKAVKKALGIKLKDKSFDKCIEELIINTTCGGTLEIFFNGDILDFIKEDFDTIIFKNPCVAIADSWNGSGSDTQFDGLTLKVKYDPNKLRFDKLIKYSYTYDVCGMSTDWCDGTDYSLNKSNRRTKNGRGIKTVCK